MTATLDHTTLATGDIAVYRPERLPNIDYDAHPAYGAHFGKARLGEQARALAHLAPHFFYMLFRDAFFAVLNLMRPRGRASDQPIAEGLRKHGALDVPLAVQDPDGFAQLNQALIKPVATLRGSRDAIGEGKRTYEQNQLLLSRNEHADVFAAVEGLLNRSGAIESAGQYLGVNLGVSAIALQINGAADSFWRARFADANLPDPKSNYLHIDTTRPAIKGILYLSDVKVDNGPFRYVAGTNSASRGFLEGVTRSAMDKSGLSRSAPEMRRMFRALPSFLRKKADFGNDLLDGDAGTASLLNAEKTFTGKPGTLVLFDNFGVHRGGMVEKGERSILQIVLG